MIRKRNFGGIFSGRRKIKRKWKVAEEEESDASQGNSVRKLGVYSKVKFCRKSLKEKMTKEDMEC
jgi:hypothetical protein